MEDKRQILIKRIRLSILLVIIFLLAWTSWLIYYSRTFHVISTNPSMDNISTVSQFIEIHFSKNLAFQSPSITSTSSVVTSSAIYGKVLKLNISTIIQGKKYTINIASVRDSYGDLLKNLTFTFTPTYIPYDSVPKSQQKAILQNQASAAKQYTLTYSGTSALINNGLTTTQVNSFESDIKNFASINKISLSNVAVDKASVEPGPQNQSGIFTLNFNITVNNSTKYMATIFYSDLTNIHLQLYSKAGVIIYDSYHP